MSDLLLAVDIGNTQIECGVFKEEQRILSFRLSSDTPRTPDELWHTLLFFFREAGLDPDRLSDVAVASVVPNQTRVLIQVAQERLHAEPLIISVDSCPFIRTLYADPRQIGADRLCNAVGGFQYYGGPLIVVDFGTAVTLDVVAEDGAYRGGIILPGPATAAAVLHRRTAQLPLVSPEFPDSVIGVTTEHGIRCGVTWGFVDMIDGLIERIIKELNSKPSVVATGGLAELYYHRCKNITRLHPGLVLDGIRTIYRRAKGE